MWIWKKKEIIKDNDKKMETGMDVTVFQTIFLKIYMI